MGTKKAKLLILIKNLDGGTGTFLRQILKLNKHYDIMVCALEKPRFSKQSKYRVDYFNNKPFHVRRYRLNPLLGIGLFKEFFWLQKKIKLEKPELILSIDNHCNLLACVTLLLPHSHKCVITNHNNILEVVKRKLSPSLVIILKISCRYLFNKADAVVCISHGAGGEFKRFFSIKKTIDIIPYGLDFTEVKRLEAKPMSANLKRFFGKKERKIISIGRFEEQKDFPTLIRAFSDLVKKVEKVKLILVGDGNDKEELEGMVSRLGIGDSVHFLGWQKNVYPLLKAADFFVLSSHYEGFGYVLLEAMSQGLPIISTDSPYGPREVLNSGRSGILVKVGQQKDMTKAMMTLLNDKTVHNKYSNKSRERVRVFREELMLNRYNKLVRNLLH